jgi:hypothetical protein
MIDCSRALWTISNEGPAASFRTRADNRARALRLRLAPKFRVQCPISEVSTRRVGPVSAYSILVISACQFQGVAGSQWQTRVDSPVGDKYVAGVRRGGRQLVSSAVN